MNKAWFIVYGNEKEKTEIVKYLDEKGVKYQINIIDMEALEVDTEDEEVGTVWFSYKDDSVLKDIQTKLNAYRIF